MSKELKGRREKTRECVDVRRTITLSFYNTWKWAEPRKTFLSEMEIGHSPRKFDGDTSKKKLEKLENLRMDGPEISNFNPEIWNFLWGNWVKWAFRSTIRAWESARLHSDFGRFFEENGEKKKDFSGFQEKNRRLIRDRNKGTSSEDWRVFWRENRTKSGFLVGVDGKVDHFKATKTV